MWLRFVGLEKRRIMGRRRREVPEEKEGEVLMGWPGEKHMSRSSWTEENSPDEEH